MVEIKKSINLFLQILLFVRKIFKCYGIKFIYQILNVIFNNNTLLYSNYL